MYNLLNKIATTKLVAVTVEDEPRITKVYLINPGRLKGIRRNHGWLPVNYPVSGN